MTQCSWEGVRPQHGLWLHKDLPGWNTKCLKVKHCRAILFLLISFTVCLNNCSYCLCKLHRLLMLSECLFQKERLLLNAYFLCTAWSPKLLFKDSKYISSNKNNPVGSLTILSLPSLSHKWKKVSSLQDTALIQHACKLFDSVCFKCYTDLSATGVYIDRSIKTQIIMCFLKMQREGSFEHLLGNKSPK